jgi:hypothetical protein
MSQRTFDLPPATGPVPAGPIPTVPPPPATLAGVVAAIRAAAGSFAVVFVPVITFWIAGSPAQTSWQQAVRVALDGWLLGHDVPVHLERGALSLAPLGLLAVPLAACWFAGRWLSRVLDPRAATVEAARAGLLRDSRVHPRAKRAATRSLVLFCVTYTAIAAVASAFARSAGVGPHAFSAALAGFLVSSTAGVCGAYAWSSNGARAGAAAYAEVLGESCVTLIRRRMPEPALTRSLRRAVPRWVRPTADVLAMVLLGGAVLTIVAVATHWGAVSDVYAALDPGWLGGAGLVVSNLLMLPNAVVWGAAFITGPGFALGAGTAVGPAGSSVGALPALPLFGAAPAPGVFPGWAWVALVLPFAAGVLAAARIIRRRLSERSQIADALGSAGLAGLALAVLCGLSSGSLGSGRMADFGPNPLLVGAVLFAEVAVSSVTTVVLWQTFRPSR